MIQCNGQLSVFDFLEQPSVLPSVEEIIELVSSKFNMLFSAETFESERFGSRKEYVYSFGKKSKLEIHESKYHDTKRRFISVNWMGKDEGFGSPCDSVDEVYKYVERAIECNGKNNRDKKH